VRAVGPRTHVEDGGHRTEIKLAVEMREQFVVARGFPAQGFAERVGIDRDQKQAGLAGIMLARRLGDLCGRRLPDHGHRHQRPAEHGGDDDQEL